VVYDVSDLDPITLRVASQCDTVRHIGITYQRTGEPFEAASRWNSVLSQFRNAP
jgi:hypothetical protein